MLIKRILMHRVVVALPAAVVVLALTTALAFAAYPTTGDGILSPTTNAYTGGASSAVLFVQSDAANSCGTQQTIAVMKFDLSGVNRTIGGATLTVSVSLIGLTGTGNVVLVPVSDTSFNSSSQGTLDATDVNVASPLVSVPFAQVPASGTFQLSSAGLASYLDGLKGGTAALALAITGCSAGNPFVGVSSSSGGAGPSLSLQSTTAVELSAFDAQQGSSTWPFYAGLGALGLLVVGGLVVSRRRSALR